MKFAVAPRRKDRKSLSRFPSLAICDVRASNNKNKTRTANESAESAHDARERVQTVSFSHFLCYLLCALNFSSLTVAKEEEETSSSRTELNTRSTEHQQNRSQARTAGLTSRAANVLARLLGTRQINSLAARREVMKTGARARCSSALC